VGLGLPPESLLISSEKPGKSDTLLQLPGVVESGQSGLAVSVFGQTLQIPKGGPHPIGSTVWLSVLRVLPRPERVDSAQST